MNSKLLARPEPNRNTLPGNGHGIYRSIFTSENLISAIYSCFNSNDNFGLLVNIVRDIVWTLLSIRNVRVQINQHHQILSINDQEYSAQFFYSALIMLPFLLISLLWRDKDETLKHKSCRMIPLYIASVIAILPWDRGQALGIQIGIHSLNITPANASYFAAIFTGLFEGPTQKVIIDISHKFLDLHDNELSTNLCVSMESRKAIFGVFVFSLMFGSTIGIIPGGIWELVYAAGVNYGVSSGLVAFAVGCSVLVANAIVLIIAKYMEPSIQLAANTIRDSVYHKPSEIGVAQWRPSTLPLTAISRPSHIQQTHETHETHHINHMNQTQLTHQMNQV